MLYRHPAVRECAVVGVRDDVKGEIAKAFIVPVPGPTPSEAELDAYCRLHLAAYERASTPRLPIFDSCAERMLVFHLGPSAQREPARPYEAFVANLLRLKRA